MGSSVSGSSSFEISINGERCIAEDPTRRLIDFLREDLGLKATKAGCRMGDCGSCTVLADDEPRLACITMLFQVRTVQTIEGLLQDSEAIRRRIACEGGYQCGFCTPAQVVMAVAFARLGVPKHELAVRSYLSGTLCRCTGSDPIVKALMSDE